ncbi:hypothetical protein [uncultured Planococcus sp.]|jgi:hypothetical protein|uniref:hypothetical protein n=1 Tax=uncultured Planococcus sp. TaxID=337815 RepID=UPI00263529C7|nr:hypothetical protein [uncultured Planococcus sp.]
MEEDEKAAALEKFQMMIRNGNRYFVRRNRNGVPYIQQLADLGLTNIEEAWEVVLNLEVGHCTGGPQYDWDDRSLGKVVWIYKVEVNGVITYIKLKDEESNRGCVCISFHEDQP